MKAVFLMVCEIDRYKTGHSVVFWMLQLSFASTYSWSAHQVKCTSYVGVYIYSTKHVFSHKC